MAKRNPYEKEKKEYFEGIRFKEVHPLVFWCECEKCKNEFRREKMYHCGGTHHLLDMDLSNYGCTECFNNIEEFKEYLEKEKLILTEDTYDEFFKQYK